MRPQITLVDPPLGSARERDAESAVQEFRIANANPSIASGEKFRLNSPLWPRLANWRSSALLFSFGPMVSDVLGRLKIWALRKGDSRVKLSSALVACRAHPTTILGCGDLDQTSSHPHHQSRLTKHDQHPLIPIKQLEPREAYQALGPVKLDASNSQSFQGR
jgi:hypothetical protein